MSARATCTSCGWTDTYPTRAAATVATKRHTCPRTQDRSDFVKQLQAFEARVVRLEATVATLTASKELLPPVDDDTLPGPTLAVIALPDWVDEALCAQTDPEAFHPTKGRPGREAKAVCGRCPVKADCLDHALAHHEESGIWGGMSPRERRKLAAHNGSPT